MPRFGFVEHEHIKRFIVFEADNLEHAKQLKEDAFSIDDLPDAEEVWNKGDTAWTEVEELD